MRKTWVGIVAALALSLTACTFVTSSAPPARPPVQVATVEHSSAEAKRFAAAAMSQVGNTLRYDASYAEIPYPGGDVPLDRGACTDVVIRAARTLGVDLQVKVHEDMARDFKAYPQRWGMPGPNTNIDHRRVPNLQTYFTRQRKSLAVTQAGADYWPGDVVTWDVGGTHMGVVSTQPSADGSRFLIVHNHGSGVHVEDFLFSHPVTGHYRPF